MLNLQINFSKIPSQINVKFNTINRTFYANPGKMWILTNDCSLVSTKDTFSKSPIALAIQSGHHSGLLRLPISTNLPFTQFHWFLTKNFFCETFVFHTFAAIKRWNKPFRTIFDRELEHYTRCRVIRNPIETYFRILFGLLCLRIQRFRTIFTIRWICCHQYLSDHAKYKLGKPGFVSNIPDRCAR